MTRYTVSLTLVLIAVWLLLSGMWTHPIILPLGAASVALTVWLAHRLGIVDRESDPLHLVLPSIKYWPWLLGQILRANLQVAARILTNPTDLSPRLARVRSTQNSDLGRSIFANSITLTPGTVTIRVSAGEIFYYAISDDLVAELDEGEMDRRVTRLEEEL
ncbi:MAG: Na+/H+ antiporter subunit E [Gammaproteobacteria bacterium]|nr:Na+/H+ antiporter subunit E [Gammaproteobacteria bacterium]